MSYPQTDNPPPETKTWGLGTMPLMPPDYYPRDWVQTKRQEFDRLCELYSINQYYAREMRTVICAPEKVIFIDNSGSMDHALTRSHLKRPFVKRYDELREFLQIAISLLAIDSEHGITLVFLNPPNPSSQQYIFEGIHSWEQAVQLLEHPSNSGTPLIYRYQEQYERIKNKITEQGILFLIATDGEPSDDRDYYGQDVGPRPGDYLSKLIKNRPMPHKFIVNFLLCTDNEDDVACYDRLDKDAIGVDVSDDYESEQAQVKRVRRGKPFTFGDYVVKALVGGASEKFDKMDEKQNCKCTLS